MVGDPRGKLCIKRFKIHPININDLTKQVCACSFQNSSAASLLIGGFPFVATSGGGWQSNRGGGTQLLTMPPKGPRTPTVPRPFDISTSPAEFQLTDCSGDHFTARWEWGDEIPRKTKYGVTGWARVDGKLIRLHVCSFNPCAAIWTASKSGSNPVPRHGRLTAPAAAAEPPLAGPPLEPPAAENMQAPGESLQPPIQPPPEPVAAPAVAGVSASPAPPSKSSWLSSHTGAKAASSSWSGYSPATKASSSS